MFAYNLCHDFRYGKIIYNVLDQWVGRSLPYYGEYCQGEADLFAQLVGPGDTIVEAGANIGSHTVHLAQLVGETGRVYAFEPQRLVFQTLCGNLAINSLPNVFALQKALGREKGMVKVPCLSVDETHNWGGVSLIGTTAGEDVEQTTIDDLQLAACRLIKIDVEGMEPDVIAGTAGTIQRCRPILYAEADRGEDSKAALAAQIKALGYQVYEHQPCLFNPGNYFHRQENLLVLPMTDANGQTILASVTSYNLLCLPEGSGLQAAGLKEL